MTRKVYIAGAVRTAIGKFGGSLADVPAAKLAEIVVKEAMQRAGIQPADVDIVYFGNVCRQGSDKTSPARLLSTVACRLRSPRLPLTSYVVQGLSP